MQSVLPRSLPKRIQTSYSFTQNNQNTSQNVPLPTRKCCRLVVLPGMEIDNNYTSSSVITRITEYDLLSFSSAEAFFFSQGLCLNLPKNHPIRWTHKRRPLCSWPPYLSSFIIPFKFLLSKSIISHFKDCSEFPTHVILILNLSRVISLLHLPPH